MHRHPLRVSSGEIVDVCIVNCLSITVFVELVCVVKSLLEITLAMPEPTFSTHTKKLNELNLSCSMKILLLAVCNHAQNEKRDLKYSNIVLCVSSFPSTHYIAGAPDHYVKENARLLVERTLLSKKPLGNYL